MNKAEVKRVAHGAVAGLIRAHLEFADNHL
jgi:hypothetical protein